MPPIVFKIAKWLAARPSDRMIRGLHIGTGLLVGFLLWFAWDRSVIDIPFVGTQDAVTEQYIEYGLLAIILFPVLRGIIPYCLMKHNTLRILQGIFGFLLIIIGGPVMDPITTMLAPAPTSGDLFQVPTSPEVISSWHPGTLLILIGIFWLIVGLTGKGTTSTCLRHGEIVKKIRV